MRDHNDPAKGPDDQSKKAHKPAPPRDLGRPGIDPDERGEPGQFTDAAAPGNQKK
jgi:hypothetical protein